jgi:hypothetical protein
VILTVCEGEMEDLTTSLQNLGDKRDYNNVEDQREIEGMSAEEKQHVLGVHTMPKIHTSLTHSTSCCINKTQQMKC